MNYVLTVSPANLKEIKKYYKKDLELPKLDHINFVAKSKAYTITGFKTNKVMFQGPLAESEYDKWKDHFGKSKAEIGSDEVGTGDFFGPIVVVAAYISETQTEFVKKLGVGDSKKLTDKKITLLAEKLIPHIKHKSVLLNNFYYNKMQDKGSNMNKIKAFLHNRAITEITNATEKLEVILDQFTTEKTYWEYLSDTEHYKKIKFETKAEDKYLSVAVASILARYYFIKEWEQLEDKFDFSFPKGASSAVDRACAKFIKVHGEDELKNVCKLNFKNLHKARNLM